MAKKQADAVYRIVDVVGVSETSWEVRSTSSFIGLKMPNRLRWGRREQAHLARLMTISPNSQIVTARATFFRH